MHISISDIVSPWYASMWCGLHLVLVFGVIVSGFDGTKCYDLYGNLLFSFIWYAV